MIMRYMANSTESYKYFAFISFQSSDAKQALWLQKAIESYRLPTALQRRDKSLPKRMRPCFCYLNDINLSEELMQELKQRMEQSEYLIVVCSPRSAKSQFVNGGIDYFVNLGRRDRIIPLIVEGLPYSADSQQECYPEALRRHFPKSSDPMQDHQILGVNINEQGAGSKRWKRQRAMLMVIARMLGLQFDNLWNREQQRKRRRSWSVAALITTILIALFATWHFARSVDINLTLSEQAPANTYLPVSHNTHVVLTLQNEQKTLDSLSIGATGHLRNIPRRFIGKQVNCHFSAPNYNTLDSLLTLKTDITLPVSRNADVFGNIHIRLRGYRPSDCIEIAGIPVTPLPDGAVSLNIPLSMQRTAYPVRVNGELQTDSIFMPCGENDIYIISPPLIHF